MAKRFHLQGNSRSFSPRGQSFVELALALPVLLLLLGGMAEIAFFINVYLDLLDATREGARYGTNLVYSSTYLYDDPSDDPDEGYCTSQTTHFYYVVGCLTEDNIERVGNINLDMTQDDIVISVFTVQDRVVHDRFPDANGWSYAKANTTIGCAPDPCPSKFTDTKNDSVTGPFETILQTVAVPGGYGQLNDAIVLVEVFYHHHQQLNLPFYNLLPDPILTYAYSFFPLPSAEPTATTPP